MVSGFGKVDPKIQVHDKQRVIQRCPGPFWRGPGGPGRAPGRNESKKERQESEGTSAGEEELGEAATREEERSSSTIYNNCMTPDHALHAPY